jgi:PilX N-terminal
MKLPPRPAHSPPSGHQRGAATLVVVMLLFFVVTLAAAYASRNMIFEQRTAANQYKSTSAQEAAEAGIEWAVTMLNSGRIDEFCEPTTDADKPSFRKLYLSHDADGKILPKLNASSEEPWAACVNTGSGWSCYCPGPDGTLPSPLPTSTQAFAVRFKSRFSGTPLGRPGVVRIEANGCTNSNIECLTAGRAELGYPACETTACSMLSQYPALKLTPDAAITAGGVVGGARLEAYNTDLRTGIAIHSGGGISVSPVLTLGGPPGVPEVQLKAADDAEIAALDAYDEDCNLCMFSSVFGLRPDTYRQQQAVVEVDCGSAGCTSASTTSALGRALAASRGGSHALDTATGNYIDRGSAVWLKGTGGLNITSATDDIGSPTAPVVLIVEGPVNISAAVKIYGVVYAASATLSYGPGTAAPSEATIRGALVTAGNVTGNGTAANPGRVIYDPTILSYASKFNGNFVRVPGTWRDFP